jgi:hypothetical protein
MVLFDLPCESMPILGCFRGGADGAILASMRRCCSPGNTYGEAVRSCSGRGCLGAVGVCLPMTHVCSFASALRGSSVHVHMLAIPSAVPAPSGSRCLMLSCVKVRVSRSDGSNAGLCHL